MKNALKLVHGAYRVVTHPVIPTGEFQHAQRAGIRSGGTLRFSRAHVRSPAEWIALDL